MPERPISSALGQLRKVLAAQRNLHLPDDELLQSFLTERDEAAFAALVKRHEAMVFGVCQSVLRHRQDAEDACQAAFLVLAKKGVSIRSRTSLASWLHGVAYRLARKLQTSRKLAPLEHATVRPPVDPADELSWREMRAILHEELERLPEKHRQPLILCYLQGLTQDEAARRLGWSAGQLKGMVDRGRDLLRQRLTRRGLALAGPLLATLLAPCPAAFGMAHATAHSAVLLRAGQAVGEGVSVQAAALAESAVMAMLTAKLKVAFAVLLAMAVLAGGVGLAVYRVVNVELQKSGKKDEVKTTQLVQGKQQERKQEIEPRLDLHGDPLPSGAVARIGTTRFLQRDGNYCYPISYTPDGKHLVSIDGGTAVVVWDASTGKEVRRIEVPGSRFYTFVLSPNGKILATVGTQDPNIRIWELGTGKEVHQISFMPYVKAKTIEHPPSAVFTPDGKALALSNSEGIIRLWDTVAWKEMSPLPKGGNTLQLPNLGVSRYYFLPDGKMLISASYAEGIRWLDIASGNEIRRVGVTSTQLYGWTLAMTADGKRLAAVVKPGVLYLWNAATGEEISRIDLGLRVDDGGHCLAFSPDGQILACNVCISDRNPYRLVRQTILFAANTGKELHRWSQMGYVQYLTWSPDSKTIAQSHRYFIDQRNAMTGKPTIEIPRLRDYVMAVGFEPDGQSAITGCMDYRVASWDAFTGKQQTPFSESPKDFEQWESFPFSGDYADGGKVAGMVNANGVLRVWQPSTGKTLCNVKDVSLGDRPQFSPDGKTVAMRDKNEVFSLWDTATGNLCYRLPAESVSRYAFSHDGHFLATATTSLNGVAQESAIRVWNSATGKIETRLTWRDSAPVIQMAFSEDGKHLISCHQSFNPKMQKNPDRVIRQWDLATGRELQWFTVPGAYLGGGHRAMVVSPDSKIVATVSASDGVILWEIATGQQRGQFSGHRSFVSSLAFSPDGKLLISGSGDYTALIWDVTGVCPDGKLVARDLAPAQVKSLWADLASEDSAKAHRALWQMVAGQRQAVPFLAERLKAVAPAEEQRLLRLIADLDSDTFKVRSQATKELEQLGDLAEPALRRALTGQPALELRQRVERLLDLLVQQVPSADKLQVLRALEALEHIATPAAHQVLEGQARGAPAAWQTREAKASLGRLGKRS